LGPGPPDPRRAGGKTTLFRHEMLRYPPNLAHYS
jgi:hypothetical protein